MVYEILEGYTKKSKKTILKTEGKIKTIEKTRQTFKIDNKIFFFKCPNLIKNDDKLIVALKKGEMSILKCFVAKSYQILVVCKNCHLGITMSIWAISIFAFRFSYPICFDTLPNP